MKDKFQPGQLWRNNAGDRWLIRAVTNFTIWFRDGEGRLGALGRGTFEAKMDEEGARPIARVTELRGVEETIAVTRMM